MKIWDEIKQRYQAGSLSLRLIFINIAIFVIAKLIGTILNLVNPQLEIHQTILNWFAVPASVPNLLVKPWTIITYQFLHLDLMHLLFNMMWLHIFGQLFVQRFSIRQVLSLYIWGGLWGGIFYIATFNLIPYYGGALEVSQMLGASASILAIVVATATAVPNQEIQLMLIGRVKIKYMASAVIILDMINITASNAGGHIAHLGGAFAGYLFAFIYFNKNRDLTSWIAKALDFIVTNFNNFGKPKNKMKARKTSGKKADMEFNKHKLKKQGEIDRILEKIKYSGYDSLSKAEKNDLFKASK